ncbi:MAG: hypothetical protein DRN78_06005 [Thermoproteota archaeon]|nr:MAG: hypothetical protein DRN78_06005 [Candidatus Korarchaeota archaeon]
MQEDWGDRNPPELNTFQSPCLGTLFASWSAGVNHLRPLRAFNPHVWGLFLQGCLFLFCFLFLWFLFFVFVCGWGTFVFWVLFFKVVSGWFCFVFAGFLFWGLFFVLFFVLGGLGGLFLVGGVGVVFFWWRELFGVVVFCFWVCFCWFFVFGCFSGFLFCGGVVCFWVVCVFVSCGFLSFSVLEMYFRKVFKFLF